MGRNGAIGRAAGGSRGATGARGGAAIARGMRAALALALAALVAAAFAGAMRPAAAQAATVASDGATGALQAGGALQVQGGVSTASADTFATDLADSSRGTEAAPYRVSTEADLFALAQTVNEGNDLSGKHVALEADVAFSEGMVWAPIGLDSSHPFSGCFDGQGHSITNFSVDLSGSSDAVHAGLFGYVDPPKGASAVVIKNLRLVGAHAGPADRDVLGSADLNGSAGGLMGAMGSKQVTVSNCVIDVNVAGYRNVGGLVGGNMSGGQQLSIANCVVLGAVKGVDSGGTEAGRIGGIVGAWGMATNASMSNCLYLGQVTPSSLLLESTSGTFVLSANALVGVVGGTLISTVPAALLDNCFYVAQGEPSVKAARAGKADGAIRQVDGQPVVAPTPSTAVDLAVRVNAGQTPHVWRVLGDALPVPAPFGTEVAYTHAVSFDVAGGEWAAGVQAALPTRYAEGGERADLPGAGKVSRPGYNFKGWYLDEALSDGPYDSAPTDGAADLTFRAKWALVCAVTFDAGAGTYAGPASAQYEEGDVVERPADPVPPEGKDFLGWYGPDGQWDFSTALRQDVALTARYRGETVTVTFDPAGGTLAAPSVAQVQVEKGTPVSRPADPVRQGYSFAGWQMNGAAYNFALPVNLETTLVAAWTKNPPQAPAFDVADASYNLMDAQYVVGEEPVALGAPAKVADGGSLSYRWYRTAAEMPDPASDERVGTGATCLPDVAQAGSSYGYYCVATNELDGEATSATSPVARVSVVATAAALGDTFDAGASVATVSTAADLAAFRDAVNGGTLAPDARVLLMHDVDLGGKPWTPIGRITSFKYGRPAAYEGFSGIFDGRGHTISGLYISTAAGGQALFAYLAPGGILHDFVVKGSVTSTAESCVAGVVAATGMVNQPSYIMNVGNEVDVASTLSGTSSTYAYVGGVLGYAGYQGAAVVMGCYNKGSVSTANGYAYVGGIAGYQASLSDCYNLGDVTARNCRTSDTYAGGISGAGSSLQRCYSSAEVRAISDSYTCAYCGALVGDGASAAACYFDASKTQQAAGTNSRLSGMTAYAGALSLLADLQTAHAGTWKDGTAANAAHGGLPALAWEPDGAVYAVGRAACEHGGFSASQAVAAAGSTVLVTPDPDEGYELDEVLVEDAQGRPVAVDGTKFVMPASDVTVRVTFKLAPQVPHAVAKAATTHGSFQVSADSALVNATITVTVAPDDGYELERVQVVDSAGASVAVSGRTFKMPARDVTVSVSFRACTYLTAKVTFYSADGGVLPSDSAAFLVDAATGERLDPLGAAVVVSGGGSFEFRVVNGHSYQVGFDAAAYELAADVTLEANELKSAYPTASAHLRAKAVDYAVSFDPGEGAFPEQVDPADLVDGRFVQVVANGARAELPAADPVREGYVFAGWFDGQTRFLSYAPVTADAAYEARWAKAGELGGDTFLLDCGSSEHDGSYARPLRLSTEQDLVDFAAAVNGLSPEGGEWVPAGSGDPQSFAGMYVSLEADVALTRDFTPIGVGSAAPSGAYAARPFSGTFLGNGHVVSGLATSAASNPAFAGSSTLTSTLVTKHVANSYAALFGAVDNATVQDVRVELAPGGFSAQAPAAGLVAQVSGGTVRMGKCSVDGDLLAAQGAAGANAAGGLVALYAPATGGSLALQSSYHDGTVSAAGTVGGLVGLVSASGAALSSCYHAGALSGSTVGAFVGGAGSDAPRVAVQDCVTDRDDPAVGGGAAASAQVSDSTVIGAATASWASSEGAGGVRKLLGDTFDFADLKANGAPRLAQGTAWESGYAVSFLPGADDATGQVPQLSRQSAGSKVVIPTCTLRRAGYTLAGWCLDGSTRVYAAGSSFTMPDADAVLTAQWEKLPAGASFTVTFEDEDGTVLLSADYAPGTPADQVSVPEVPQKPATDEFAYSFAGWDAPVSDVQADATYRATYTAQRRSYRISWYSGDQLLAVADVPYGTVPSYGGAVPTRAATADVVYSFAGWDPAMAPVKGDAAYRASFAAAAKPSIEGARVVLARASAAYTGKVQKGAVKSVTLGGKTLRPGVDYTVVSTSGKKVGSYKVSITGTGAYRGAVTATFKVVKAKNTLRVKSKKATVRAAKLAKGRQKLARSKVLKVTKARGAVTYAKVSGNKKVKVARNGRVILGKGLKKGAYKVKVRVRAKGNASYAPATRTVTFNIRVR